jgi:acyl carrier protein
MNGSSVELRTGDAREATVAIAKALRRDEHQIDPQRPVSELDIDSVAAAELSRDLEEWDYLTIALLAAHLASPVPDT